MPAYADDDLISLADEPTITSPVSNTSVASASSRMVASHHSPVKLDSFFDLTVMMKAKRPYTQTFSTSRAPLSLAANGMQFATQTSSGTSIPSPLARPFQADGSVVAYLQNQACSSPTAVASPNTGYNEQRMQRLDSMLKELDDIPVDEVEDDHAAVQPTQTKNVNAQPLLPGFEPFSTISIRTGSIAPPTPAASTEPRILPTEPVVNVTVRAWEAMGRDLQGLKDEKRALELKIARWQKLKAYLPQLESDNEEALKTEIGYLKYQNEQNKTQKTIMGRTLSQKDVEIKQLQLDLSACKEALERADCAAKGYAEDVGKRDYIQTQLRDDETTELRRLSDLNEAKNREVHALTQQLSDLGEVVRRSGEEERYKEHKDLAEVRLGALNKCEKQLRSVNAKYAAEHARVNELEDHIELLQNKLNEVGDLQTQLSQKSADCDRWRNKYKNQEKVVETCKRQVERAADENTCLRGAAHLVKPAISSKLSPVVMSCSECYAKNITCDNKARCRHCTENNESCARWRCSLRHHLGQCPRVPCTFPHGEDGWLLAPDPRPQW